MARLGSSDLDVYPLNLGGNTFGWTSDKDTSFAVLDAYAAAAATSSTPPTATWRPCPGCPAVSPRPYSGSGSPNVATATRSCSPPRWPAPRVPWPRARQHRPGGGSIAASACRAINRLYYAHYDDEAVPLADSLGAFDELVRAGKVRYVGISNYSPARVQQWLAVAEANGFARPVALQPHYNLVAREPFESQYRPLAERFDLGVLPYFALAAGFLSGKYRSEADLEGAHPCQDGGTLPLGRGTRRRRRTRQGRLRARLLDRDHRGGVATGAADGCRADRKREGARATRCAARRDRPRTLGR